ncbi:MULTISPECIES: helix-turn-helix domain-containing protein [Microbacterium]|uniref:Helix-turn-helix transcriptional regulator n=1 Tax=Microbacterium aurantiacum TaxID=162393 RepID=A0AAJ2HHK3_9MICO|nr:MULTISPECIES: helix-turn-helix transcriptional regulator [Microbacterium]MDS0244610.1 helix-turn-helix transcriptional regulator [Microbacterium aurantiacum]
MRRDSSSNSDWSAYVREIGTNIQRQRLARGYSQDRVAYEANLSRYTFQKLEKGESRPDSAANPRLMTLLAVAQVLDVELTVLLPQHAPDIRAR